MPVLNLPGQSASRSLDLDMSRIHHLEAFRGVPGVNGHVAKMLRWDRLEKVEGTLVNRRRVSVGFPRRHGGGEGEGREEVAENLGCSDHRTSHPGVADPCLLRSGR